MKLKEEFVKLPKELVYDIYERIVVDSKDYENISRNKMIDSIIEQYEKTNFLYNICTKKELDFLECLINKKIKKSQLDDYEWEINALYKKGIYSKRGVIFEEQQENVKKSLEFYQKNKENKEKIDEIVIFMIGYVKTQADMLINALKSFVKPIFKLSDEDVEILLDNPLLNFYCDFYIEYMDFSQKDERFIYYRDYYDLIDEIDEERKKYGIAGCKEIVIEDYYDMFYYGFPLSNSKMERMYEAIKSLPFLGDLIFEIIEFTRLFNDRNHLEELSDIPELYNLINDVLDDIPCAVMNGFTPNEYKKEQEKEKNLNTKLTMIPQNNAHLCKNAADLFYKLYFALLDYTNKKYKIEPSLKKIYKQEGLDVNKILPIDEYLWEHKEVIDEFVNKNEKDFTEEEIDIIKGFKTAIRGDNFVIVGYEREYTQILDSKEKKIYMVKGVRANFDELIDAQYLPKVIITTLLMFKDKIIYNSFFSHVNVIMGNDFKESVLKECEKAKKCYHL